MWKTSSATAPDAQPGGGPTRRPRQDRPKSRDADRGEDDGRGGAGAQREETQRTRTGSQSPMSLCLCVSVYVSVFLCLCVSARCLFVAVSAVSLSVGCPPILSSLQSMMPLAFHYTTPHQSGKSRWSVEILERRGRSEIVVRY